MRLAEEAMRVVAVVRQVAAPFRSRWEVFATGSRILLKVVDDDPPLVQLLVIAPPSMQNVIIREITLFSNYAQYSN